MISSLGWVDGGALWCFDFGSNRERKLSLGNAQYLSLHSGIASFFAVAHHFNGDKVEITAHTFADPGVVLSRCIVNGDTRRIEGDSTVWVNLPRYYVEYLKQPTWSDFALIELGPGETVSLQTFDWYNDQYDKGYQGIVGVTTVPGSHLVIVSVQRDSKPIIYDPIARRKVGEISLAGGHGNPTLYFRRTARELWADDYDTLLALEPDTWRVVRKTKLQDAAVGTAQFIGRFLFDADEQICAVARPFSGDIVGLDPNTLEVRYRAKVGKQPLEVAILRDLRVFARDWKTGEFIKGALQRA
jgi:hypothetical protein